MKDKGRKNLQWGKFEKKMKDIGLELKLSPDKNKIFVSLTPN